MAKSVEQRLEAAGPFLRDIVFGVHDALLTNIGIVTGFVTALQSHHLIIVAALIDVIVSAFAMAFGTYLSRTSENEYLKDQLETDVHADVQSALAHPVSAAVVMWFTYVVSGMIPLIPFFFGLTDSTTIRFSIIVTLVVFFIVGVLKGLITRTDIWRSGLQFILFGGVAATIGYVVGSYGQQFIH